MANVARRLNPLQGTYLVVPSSLIPYVLSSLLFRLRLIRLSRLLTEYSE